MTGAARPVLDFAPLWIQIAVYIVMAAVAVVAVAIVVRKKRTEH